MGGSGALLPSAGRPTLDLLASQSWLWDSFLEQDHGGTYLLGFLMLLKVDEAKAPGLPIAVSHHLHALYIS